MKIKIKDRSVCENCTNRTCAFIDARIKEQFYSLRTETTVCPTGILMDDTPSAANSHDYIEKNCVQCGLCVKSCCQNNLLVENGDNDIFDLSGLSEFQQNAIALSCLDNIMGFAANTNRNRSINFDGFAQNRKGESCFVEVDYGDDSLECCRRLIGDFITYEGNIGPIRNGLMVLKELPREGSRDVYGVLSKLRLFPTTQDCRIYFTTFDILRYLMLNVNTEQATLSQLFCNPWVDSVDNYEKRIRNENLAVAESERIIQQVSTIHLLSHPTKYPYSSLETETLPIAADIIITGSIDVCLHNTKCEDLMNGRLDLILMYAIPPIAREKTEKSGKIALGIKEKNLTTEAIMAFKSVKYIIFHYWSNAHTFKLTCSTRLVVKENIHKDFLIRQEKEAVQYLLIEYNPTEQFDLGKIDIMKVHRQKEERYMPFVCKKEDIM